MHDGKYAEAAIVYEELGIYEDSTKLGLYAKAADAGERGDFVVCLNGFTNLGDFQDSQCRLKYYTARQYEASGHAYATEDAIQASKDYAKATTIYMSLSHYLDADVRQTKCIQAMYDLPASLATSGDFAGAANVMNAFIDYMEQEHGGVGIYADAYVWVEYYTACHNETNGAYLLASEGFSNLGNFIDAPQRAMAIQQATYEAAEDALEREEPLVAWNLFTSIPEYKDSIEHIKETQYLYGKALMEGHDYAEARICFASIGDYSDAVKRYKESWYAEGNALLNASFPDYEGAKTAFEKAGDYCDAATRYASYWYNKGKALLVADVPDYEGAKAAFEMAGEYNDALEFFAYGCDYQKAQDLLNVGDSIGAYKEFIRIIGYRDVDALLSTNSDLLSAAEIVDHEDKIAPFKEVGNYVTYGTYEQDNDAQNGAEPIEWLVLNYDEKAQEVLLVSRYGLDSRQFHHSGPYPTWAKSDIRAWLNSEFLNAAFTLQEQAAIVQTNISTADYRGYGDSEDTLDFIFLLSKEEAREYLPSNFARQLIPTEYAVIRGNCQKIRSETNSACWWWLRSPGYSGKFGTYIYLNGVFSNYASVNDGAGAVRPAFKLDLNSF